MTNKIKRYLEMCRELFSSLLFPRRCPVCDEILAPEEYEKGIISEKVWVSFDKAIKLYENMKKEKLEILVSKRELPVLLKAIKYLED